MPTPQEFILTLSCPDAKGIVYAVSGLLYSAGCNILDSQQFGDVTTPENHGTGLFFMRVHFEAPPHLADTAMLDTLFTNARDQFGMTARFDALARRPRLLLMVSKYGHCLNDLLFRRRSGQLSIEVPLVLGNHRDLAGLAGFYGVPFEAHAVDSPQTKAAFEQRVIAAVEEHDVELVVLARYMQILSPELCERLAGRAINIHHSFLPGFKGANPYKQAHSRGVKLIGATAHFVTADLDEGPIIEQNVVRVDHAASARELVATGQDEESRTLSRAVGWYAQHRVLLDGRRTIIFR